MTSPHIDIFVIISPLKRTRPFNWTNWNFLHSRIICTKFDWFWPAGSGEEDFFFLFSVYFYSFAIISSWRGVIPFIWRNVNPLPLRMIYAILVNISPVVLEKKISKWPHPIFTFLWLFLLRRGPGPLFEQTWISFTQG
jgi:hypothetical protein